jgi:hypothetical protein
MLLRSFLDHSFVDVDIHSIGLARLNCSSRSRLTTIRRWIIVLATGTLLLGGCSRHELTRESDLVIGHVEWVIPPADASSSKPLCTPQSPKIPEELNAVSDNSGCLNSKDTSSLPVLLANSDNLSNGLRLTLKDLRIGLFKPDQKDPSTGKLIPGQLDVSRWYQHPSTQWSKKKEYSSYPSIKEFVDSCVESGEIDVKKVSNPITGAAGISLNLKINFISPIDGRQSTEVTEKWMRKCDCLTTTDERYRGCFADRVIGLAANVKNACEDKKFKCSGKDLLGSESDPPLYLAESSFNRLSTSVFSPTASYETFLQRSRGLRVGYGVIGERIFPGESICIHSSQGETTYDSSMLPYVNAHSIGTTDCYEVGQALPLARQLGSTMSVDPLATWYPLQSLTRWPEKNIVKPINSAHGVLTEPDAIGRRGKYKKGDNGNLDLGNKYDMPVQAMYLVRQLPLRLEGEAITRVIDDPIFKKTDYYKPDTPHPSSLLTSYNVALVDYLIDRWGVSKADGKCCKYMLLAAQSSKSFNVESEDRWQIMWQDVCICLDNQEKCNPVPSDYGQFGYFLFPASNDPYVAFNITVNNQLTLVRTGTTLLHILQKNIGGGVSPAGTTLIGQEVDRVFNAAKTITLKRQGRNRWISIDPSSASDLHDLMIPLLPGDELLWQR